MSVSSVGSSSGSVSQSDAYIQSIRDSLHVKIKDSKIEIDGKSYNIRIKVASQTGFVELAPDKLQDLADKMINTLIKSEVLKDNTFSGARISSRGIEPLNKPIVSHNEFNTQDDYDAMKQLITTAQKTHTVAAPILNPSSAPISPPTSNSHTPEASRGATALPAPIPPASPIHNSPIVSIIPLPTVNSPNQASQSLAGRSRRIKEKEIEDEGDSIQTNGDNIDIDISINLEATDQPVDTPTKKASGILGKIVSIIGYFLPSSSDKPTTEKTPIEIENEDGSEVDDEDDNDPPSPTDHLKLLPPSDKEKQAQSQSKAD